jgi:diguanylate cyclase (GGDEF)-like protein
MELFGDARGEARTMARVAGVLYLIGSGLTVAGVLIPHSAKADVNAFWIMAAGMAVVGAVLLRAADRLPPWSFPAVMLLGSVIITLSLYFNGERLGGHSAGNQVLYVWIALYSGYFFTFAVIALQLLAVAGLYALALVAIDAGSVGLTRWTITVVMVFAAAELVHLLKTRNDKLVERLIEAARTDSLTGLANRQAFDERLAQELARSRRSGNPTSLVIADVDRFKEINDSLGHPVGDKALIKIADAARQLARGTDLIARIGGDEFAVILPETPLDGAYRLAERLRREAGSNHSGLSLSFGVAVSGRDLPTPDTLVGAADSALYEAKRAGRDQTSVTRGAEIARA